MYEQIIVVGSYMFQIYINPIDTVYHIYTTVTQRSWRVENTVIFDLVLDVFTPMSGKFKVPLRNYILYIKRDLCL